MNDAVIGNLKSVGVPHPRRTAFAWTSIRFGISAAPFIKNACEPPPQRLGWPGALVDWVPPDASNTHK